MNYFFVQIVVFEVLFNIYDLPQIMRGKENRYLAYGKTNAGHFLLVVLITASRKTRIITARDMTEREKKFYRRNYSKNRKQD